MLHFFVVPSLKPTHAGVRFPLGLLDLKELRNSKFSIFTVGTRFLPFCLIRGMLRTVFHRNNFAQC